MESQLDGKKGDVVNFMEIGTLPHHSLSENMTQDYQVSLAPIEDLQEVADDWNTLSKLIRPSFFLSWEWVGNWYHTIQSDALVLRVSAANKLVALGLVSHNQQRVAKVFVSQAFYFHQTGDELKDQIWPEYNSLLVHPDHEAFAIEAAMEYMRQSELGFDELRLGATLEKDVRLFDSCFESRHDTWTTSAYGVDLVELRNSQRSYLDSLSRNTRYQIKRSFRHYEESDRPLVWTAAESATQAVEFFEAMGPMHQQRWGAGLGESGFSNQLFVDFHKTLLLDNWDKGFIDLICLRAGKGVVGYFYNFKYNGKAYFYMSGLSREEDPKLKPGLCGHSMLIEHYLSAGYDFYDFLGGNERYKKSLGVQHSTLYQSSYRWSRYFFVVEAALRKVKRFLFSKN